MPIAEELQVVIKAEVNRAIRELGRFDSSVDSTEGKMRRMGETSLRVGQNLSRSVTVPLAAAGVASVKFAADIEKQQTALKVLVGSAEEAAAIYEDWQEFAASTPFQLEDISQAGKQLIAFGESAGEVTETMRRLGDVSAGIGAPLSEIAEIYGKARVQGQLFAEDLNQLAGRGVPIFRELADVMGVAEGEVKQLASQGEVGFSQLETVFRNLSDEGGQFAGMMEELSQTTAGKASTALDNLKQAAAELGVELLPLANELLDSATNLAQRFGDLDDRTQRMIIAAAGAAAAFGPLVSVAGKAITVVNTLRPAMVALNATMLANPAVAVTAAVAGLATVVGGALIRNSRRAAREQEDLADSINETADAAERLNGSWDESVPLFNRLRLVGLQPLDDVLADLIDESDTWADAVETLEGHMEGLEESIEYAQRRIESGEKGLAPAVERAIEMLELMGITVRNLRTEFGANQEQETYNRLLEELNEEWANAEKKAEVFGEEFDLINEQIQLYEGFIEDAIEAGISLNNQAFQKLIANFRRLKESAEEAESSIKGAVDALASGLTAGPAMVGLDTGDEGPSGIDVPWSPEALSEYAYRLIKAEQEVQEARREEMRKSAEAAARYRQAEVDAAMDAAREQWELAMGYMEGQHGSLISDDVGDGIDKADWVGVGADIATKFAEVLQEDTNFNQQMMDLITTTMRTVFNMAAPGLGEIFQALIDLWYWLGERFGSEEEDPAEEAARARERRIEELNDLLDEELRIRDEALRELNDRFALEFDVLRDQWERNLIDTEQFVREMEGLGDEYDAEEDTINREVERIREILERIEDPLGWLRDKWDVGDVSDPAAIGNPWLSSSASGSEFVSTSAGGSSNTTIIQIENAFGDDAEEKIYEGLQRAQRRGRIGAWGAA